MRELDITPIAGLVHHGSGPSYVNFFDGSFENGLADYARTVAEKFPWIQYYTPVNEPLTTARFCGLYGHWYPHTKAYLPFFRILISECKATILAMRAIREINPDARLIQTEDLGKCHATPALQYQADFENERRWLSYELLCGTLTPDKVMYQYMLKVGIKEEELKWFHANNCRPDVAGFNYYLTSERYLDEDLGNYPRQYHGGNRKHRYADIHTVHVSMEGKECGPYTLLKEAWERLQLPLAITECHLHSTREDQIRWFHSMWETVNKVKAEGVDFRAITAWALFGLTGWNRLCTEPGGVYEPGAFNVSTGTPRPTALARYLQELTMHKAYYHPILEKEGWWLRENRQIYSTAKLAQMEMKAPIAQCRPLLVLGDGALGSAFSKICEERNIHHRLLGRHEFDITNRQAIEQLVKELNPWAIVNATEYADVDKAEEEYETCLQVNTYGPILLARICHWHAIRFLTFSTDLVFDGKKSGPYVESDPVAPLNMYGRCKSVAEEVVLTKNPHALVVRTSGLFAPWDKHNFVSSTLRDLERGKQIIAANDVVVSPTYIPDLVHASLDLIVDGEERIYHIANKGSVTCAELARRVAEMAGYQRYVVKGVPSHTMQWEAERPRYSVLKSEKGIYLPSLNDALERYFEEAVVVYQPSMTTI